MSAVLTEEQSAYLAAHQWGVLATTRQDGSPQQSVVPQQIPVGYTLDAAGHIVISTKAYTAKWRNARRQPHVSLTVVEGRTWSSTAPPNQWQTTLGGPSSPPMSSAASRAGPALTLSHRCPPSTSSSAPSC